MRSFKEKLMDWITLLDQWLSEPEDEVQILEWIDSAEALAYSYEFTTKEQPYVDQIIEMSVLQLRRNMNATIRTTITSDQIQALLGQKQTEQRTAAWYEQMCTVLSASELGNLFASARQRAKFVLSKTMSPVPRMQPLATPSDYMGPFDWGIRFEPVVKQIYEDMHKATIADLGRMHHPTDPRCTASPDGVITSGSRMGRLIEIKCPVTREIDGTVPKDYYAQMQMQLHVTGLMECDYVEAVFSSRYNQFVMKEGPSRYEGWIAVIRYAEPKAGQDFYYVYSPLYALPTWRPECQIDEEIIEITPWRLQQWSEQVIVKNEEWWKAMKPMMAVFWEDVEKAKQGEFVVPDSTRPAKKQKTEKCIIQFEKDEVRCSLFPKEPSIIVHKLEAMEL